MTHFRFLVAFCILTLSSFPLIASPVTSIKRFPHQDSTRVAEAFPLALSASTVMIVWSDSASVRCATSTNGGESWNAPILITTPAVSANSLSGIRTLSGRLIACWKDNLDLKYTYSDDSGGSWSAPVTLPVTLVHSMHVSQTSDGKLWMGIAKVIGPSVFLSSTDNGSTWSAPQSLSLQRKFDMTFMTGTGDAVHCFCSPSVRGMNPQSAIERITSTDGGLTWSSPVTIVGPAERAYRPRLVKHGDGTIRLLYEYTRTDSFPRVRLQTDIEYLTSSDSGVTWGAPAAFTRFVGDDILHNVAILNDQPFTTFTSSRWITEARPATQIWYGILGQTPDGNPPPMFLGGSSFYSYAGVDNWINATVDDESGLAAVTATYRINGIAQPPVTLFDDGLHLDGAPNDNVWGNVIAPLPEASIELRFTVSDLDSNTLHNRFGDAFTSTPPPQSSHVRQGTSMKIAFDNSAVFGRYAMASGNYPSFGILYPVPSLIEHLYGAGIWIGGKIDTSRIGTGERIKTVSTGYEGWAGPLREFFPPNPATDTVWRVYGRNAPEPPGWGQYWGTSLPYRAPGDQNFFCHYEDYNFRPIGHVPMGVKVIQSSFTWDDAPGHAVQILDFRIMNNSGRSIDSAYIGFLADTDVGPITAPTYWQRNSSGYYADVRTAYTFNPVDYGSTPIGLALVNTHRPLDSLRVTFQWYPGQLSPSPDIRRYEMMSLGTIKPDEYPSTSDSRFFVSYGPFTIRPFNAPEPETLRVAFAFVSGVDLNQLRDAAVRARTLYSTYILDVPQEQSGVPGEFALEQNYPNPFNPVTTIKYELPAASNVTITVLNILGQKVKTLVDGVRSAGAHEVRWDGTNNAGLIVGSGVYFYRIEARSQQPGNSPFMQVKKMVLLR